MKEYTVIIVRKFSQVNMLKTSTTVLLELVKEKYKENLIGKIVMKYGRKLNILKKNHCLLRVPVLRPLNQRLVFRKCTL